MLRLRLIDISEKRSYQIFDIIVNELVLDIYELFLVKLRSVEGIFDRISAMKISGREQREHFMSFSDSIAQKRLFS